MGEIRDRAMALAALVEAFGVKDFTPVRTRAYDDSLKDVPLPLLNAAVRRAIQTRSWFPKVAELRADAEACRRELLEAHTYERCADCNFTGNIRLPSTGPKPLYGRCKCWAQYQERMSQLGITEKPVARLTAGAEVEPGVGEPALDDLPPAITDEVRALAGRKAV